MSTSERPLVEATLMAIDEINRDGGILGCRIQPVIKDGGSEPEKFATQARVLIEHEHAATLFGCWTSASRKAVKSVVEDLNSLLWYPVQHEGLEESPNIVYTGSCPNQQIGPAVEWFLRKGKSRCLLVGSDYVFPRVANKLIAGLVNAANATVVADCYFPLNQFDFSSILRPIAEYTPDIIFSTLNGDSNFAFFHMLHVARVSSESLPVVSFSVSEGEQAMLGKEAAGNFSCCSYFESLDTSENNDFVRRFKNRCGASQHSSNPIISAYSQPFLWKNAAERAKSFQTNNVRQHLTGSHYHGPAGILEIQSNHYVKKPALIGRARENGQFDIVWRSNGTIEPKPWLGLEDVNLPQSALIKDALGSFPEAIYFASTAKRDYDELAGVYSNAPVGLCTFDRDFRYRRINQRLADLMNLSIEEHIGKSVDEIVPDLAPRIRSEAQKVL
jgi:urea ABC transporter urea binding protein